MTSQRRMTRRTWVIEVSNVTFNVRDGWRSSYVSTPLFNYQSYVDFQIINKWEIPNNIVMRKLNLNYVLNCNYGYVEKCEVESWE